MTRRATAEPMLPLDFHQPRRGGWKRTPSATREDPQLYRAVLHLRRSGRAVYRQGDQHKVGGKIASRWQLLFLAASLGWTP